MLDRPTTTYLFLFGQSIGRILKRTTGLGLRLCRLDCLIQNVSSTHRLGLLSRLLILLELGRREVSELIEGQERTRLGSRLASLLLAHNIGHRDGLVVDFEVLVSSLIRLLLVLAAPLVVGETSGRVVGNAEINVGRHATGDRTGAVAEA